VPYQRQIGVATPPNGTVIWRYLDLPKLLSLLDQRALYFALLGELADRWEGILSKGTREAIEMYAQSASATVADMVRSFNSDLGVNCWHIDKDESIAMWSLYTSWKPGSGTDCYGTAIKSSVSRLKAALARFPERVVIGSVRYENHDAGLSEQQRSSGTNAFEPAFQKRTCYRHEKELRAAVVFPPCLPAPIPKHGALVPVDLEYLIESIVLCPSFPSWGKTLLKSSLARENTNPEIIESNVLVLPAERGFR
jgi:hypothetical protein